MGLAQLHLMVRARKNALEEAYSKKAMLKRITLLFFPKPYQYKKGVSTAAAAAAQPTSPSERPSTLRPANRNIIFLHTRPRVTHETVGCLLDIVACCTNGVVQVSLVNAARVVSAESFIVVAISLIKLLQPITIFRPARPVPHHLQDTALRIRRVERNAVMALHKARVTHAVVSSPDTNIAAGFLHDDAKDTANVDAGLGAYFLDGRLDETDFLGGGVEFHERAVLLPESVVRGPFVARWVGGCGTVVVDVASTAVGTAVGANDFAVSATVAAFRGRRRAFAGELDFLADLEGLGIEAWVGVFEGLEADAVCFGDLKEGVAAFDCVAHDYGVENEI